MNYSDILPISMAALQLMFYKAHASSLLQRPDPVPSRLSRGTGWDGTGSGWDFQNGTGLCLRWSLCLWHNPHAFGIIPMPLAWSPCL